MAYQMLVPVKGQKSRRSFDVKWDPTSHEVYVNYGGWALVGKAYSASEAMNKAEAWLYDK